MIYTIQNTSLFINISASGIVGQVVGQVARSARVARDQCANAKLLTAGFTHISAKLCFPLPHTQPNEASRGAQAGAARLHLLPGYRRKSILQLSGLGIIVQRHADSTTMVPIILADDIFALKLPEASIMVAASGHQVRRVG
jgi:hypothetical protein